MIYCLSTLLGQWGFPSGSVILPPKKAGNWLASISSKIATNHFSLFVSNILIFSNVLGFKNGLAKLNITGNTLGTAL